MSRLNPIRIFSLLILGAALIGCGPRETPEQHLAKLRRAHTIVPTGATTVAGPEDAPRLVVDFRITNQGTEKLNHLTVRVRVEGPDGTERLSKRVTLDLSDVRPGVGVQMAALIDDFQLDENDQVTIEVEDGLSPEELRALPEFSDITP